MFVVRWLLLPISIVNTLVWLFDVDPPELSAYTGPALLCVCAYFLQARGSRKE